MELLIVIAIFALFLSFGVMSVVFETRAAKKGANWGFHVPEVQVETQNHPIDLAYNTGLKNTGESLEPMTIESFNEPIELDAFETHEVSEFEVSAITAETQDLLNGLQKELNENNLQNNDISQITETERAALEEIVGVKVANLVTAIIPNLPENEEVVTVGKYDSNVITYNDISIPVAHSEIYSDPNDYIVLKGNMLPNGEFRVITWEDAQTIELGYAGEEFILKKRGA